MAPSEERELPPLAVDSSHRASRRVGGRRVSLVMAGVAAAVIVLFGIGLGTVLLHSRSSGTGHVVASAALEPVDGAASGGGSIKAVAIGDTRRLTVRATGLAEPASQHFYEVWLLDPRTQKMLPVGVLPPSGSGSYSMAASIMDGYSAVDVSLQENNGNPAHSSSSVLRAVL